MGLLGGVPGGFALFAEAGEAFGGFGAAAAGGGFVDDAVVKGAGEGRVDRLGDQGFGNRDGFGAGQQQMVDKAGPAASRSAGGQISCTSPTALAIRRRSARRSMP